MFNRSGIIAASAALIGVVGFASSAKAFPTASQLQKRAAQQQHYIPSFLKGVPGFHVPNAAQMNRNLNKALTANRNNINRNTAANKKPKTPTQLVLENLKVAQSDLEKKNTSDAIRQLQGSENILANWSKYPANGDTNAGTTVEKALKDVRDARSSLNSKKMDDATTSIADAIASLKGSTGEDKKKKNNNN